ncbi:helix-turn-helix transcriptional regulator [Janthinobacterium sp.]|uniref:helix-turn-helix domain-containing protein n=1 Tax=Janthinobacterium sp. TaxID=1871054 RepID=UPI002632CDCE|nr:helix-turn-helix transcriptional regulator [Janthinobacterium sp.]
MSDDSLFSPPSTQRGQPRVNSELGERFGTVIRRLRESRGWSQEYLAGHASLNRSYMGEIERATVMPSLATAEKLAQAFGVALSDLISRCERTTVA